MRQIRIAIDRSGARSHLSPQLLELVAQRRVGQPVQDRVHHARSLGENRREDVPVGRTIIINHCRRRRRRRRLCHASKGFQEVSYYHHSLSSSKMTYKITISVWCQLLLPVVTCYCTITTITGARLESLARAPIVAPSGSNFPSPQSHIVASGRPKIVGALHCSASSRPPSLVQTVKPGHFLSLATD